MALPARACSGCWPGARSCVDGQTARRRHPADAAAAAAGPRARGGDAADPRGPRARSAAQPRWPRGRQPIGAVARPHGRRPARPGSTRRPRRGTGGRCSSSSTAAASCTATSSPTTRLPVPGRAVRRPGAGDRLPARSRAPVPGGVRRRAGGVPLGRRARRRARRRPGAARRSAATRPAATWPPGSRSRRPARGLPLAFQLLVYPVTDADRDDRERRAVRRGLLPHPGLHGPGARRALHRRPPTSRDPRVSPAYAELPPGLAPAYVVDRRLRPAARRGRGLRPRARRGRGRRSSCAASPTRSTASSTSSASGAPAGPRTPRSPRSCGRGWPEPAA